MNAEFSTVFRRGSFMSACCLVVQPSGRATFASAGHPPLLIWRASSKVEELPATGTLLGIGPTLEVTDTVCHLAPGDRAVLYTTAL